MRRQLPATFKPCPKCGGSGRILDDGKGHFREAHRLWAEGYHLRPVIYSRRGIALPGLAVKELLPGGWHDVKVYVGVTDISTSGVHSGYTRGSPFQVREVEIWQYDSVNGRALWFTTCPWWDRAHLTPIEGWPEIIDELKLRLLSTAER